MGIRGGRLVGQACILDHTYMYGVAALIVEAGTGTIAVFAVVGPLRVERPSEATITDSPAGPPKRFTRHPLRHAGSFYRVSLLLFILPGTQSIRDSSTPRDYVVAITMARHLHARRAHLCPHPRGLGRRYVNFRIGHR